MHIRKLLTVPIKFALRRMGYEIISNAPPALFPRDYERETIKEILDAKKYTMTPIGRIVALCEATRYITQHGIPGEIVECGVWKGGSMMAVAQTLIRMNHQERHLYLFDTFEGMSRPTDADVMWDGQRAQDIWEVNRNPDSTNRYCLAPLEGVKEVMRKTGYDATKIHFIKGRVEDTVPSQAPSTIALLRLDTDWYESTKHELHHLFPRLSRGGIIIVDDYGCWEGAKKAVDEYLKETGTSLFLHRIDEDARISVKL